MERDPAWDVRGRLAVSCLAIRPVVSAALSPECVGDAGFLNGAVASARRHDKRYGDEWSGDGPQRTGAHAHPETLVPSPRSVLGMLGSSAGPSLPHAVMTRAMAMSGAAMVRNERVRRTVVLVICSSALIEVC
jgi:hypothetical protein